MIQQMMMLMRIEMQLRQQAMLHFQQSQDADSDRAPGLDDALALNSQLSEISSVLATLIRLTSAGQRSGGQRRPAHRNLPGLQRLRRADTVVFPRSAALRRLSNLSRQWRDTDTTVSDDFGVTDDNDNDSADDDDDYETVDVNNVAPANDIVDNFIWRQLTESRAAVDNVLTESRAAVDNIMRSSPDGMSAMSPVSNVQSQANVSSAASLPSLPSVSRAVSEQSLSSTANVPSYSPSLSSSTSYEGQPGMPRRYVVSVNSYELATPEGECPCQMCSAFNHVTVADNDNDNELLHDDDNDDDEELLGGSHHDIHEESYCDCGEEPYCECGAAASSPHFHEYETACHTQDMSMSHVEPTATIHRTRQHYDHSPQASHMSLPAVDREPTRQSVLNTSLLLPRLGARQPFLNYAARLRRQASNMTRLPSEVTIRPWPFPDSVADTPMPSPSVSGIATRRVGPSSRSSVRPLLTYTLPPHQSDVSTAAWQNAGHGRTTRSSRYNTSLSGDRTHIPRP